MEIYLECIVEEEKQARESISDMEPEDEQEREDMLNKKYNAAVDEMERVAAQFNAEVQAFRAREDG
jgi:vacuolar-type H+-ATPase subunit H